jgi:DNA-binding MarR family transcriptional regulator
MIDMENNEVRHLFRLYWQVSRLLDRELSSLELGHGRYLYLFGLYIRDGRKQQELADIIGIDKAAVTRALGRLEQTGYVRRAPDGTDGRVTRVFLTARGQELRPALEAAAAAAIDQLTAPLTASERDTLRALLAKVATPIIAG